MNHPDQLLNLKVKITNLLDQSLTATIHGISANHDVLALRFPSSSSNKGIEPKYEAYKIVNTSFIKSLELLLPTPKKGKSLPTQTLNKTEFDALQSLLNSIVEVSKSKRSCDDILAEKRQFSRRTDISSLAFKVFNRLSKKLGTENVRWHGNESIIVFEEIIVSKPFALNKISQSRKSQLSKHINILKTALRETWLEVDNGKRGG